jgi:hypothetical protein
MKRLLCSIVMLSMIAAAAPIAAAGDTTTPSTPKTGSIRAAIQQAATHIELDRVSAPAMQTAGPQSGAVPRSMPRARSNEIRRSGTAMVVGVVTSLIGVATTVYLVKQMKKTTDQTKQQ